MLAAIAVIKVGQLAAVCVCVHAVKGKQLELSHWTVESPWQVVGMH